MAESYTIGDLTFNGVKQRTIAGTETINFKVWGGSLRINVTKDKEFKPIFEKALNGEKTVALKRVIRQVMKASPGTKHPLVISEYKPQEKTWKTDYVITFVKDDKNLYRIEVQWAGNKFEALLKGPSGLANGSDPMSDAEKSSIAIETLNDWLDNVAPIQCILSNKKRELPSGSNSSYSAKGSATQVDNSEDFF